MSGDKKKPGCLGVDYHPLDSACAVCGFAAECSGNPGLERKVVGKSTIVCEKCGARAINDVYITRDSPPGVVMYDTKKPCDCPETIYKQDMKIAIPSPRDVIEVNVREVDDGNGRHEGLDQ